MIGKPRRPRLEVLEERCVLDSTFGKLFTTEHIDFGLDYINGKWDLASEEGTANYHPEATLHYVGPNALTNRPAGSQWDFIGPAGAQVYILPQNQNTSLLYLGIAAEDTPTGTFAAYVESDPRLPSSAQRWITGEVLAVRGPEGARFSMWQTNAFGAPIPWVSVDTNTAPDPTDRFYIIEGGHAHYNWGFTHPGNYEIDVRASGYLGANQTNQTVSPTTTFYFHVADTLRVTSLTPTESGFIARFNRPIDLSVLNLYDSQGGMLGPADVTLVGANTGPIQGSLVVPRVDNRQAVVNALNAVEFIATGGPLPPDTYTVTLRRHNAPFAESNGFKTTASPTDTSILASTFTTTFTINPPQTGTRIVSIADFARGPGQAVNVPAATATAGIPLTLSEGTGVRSLSFTLTWNPALLQISSASTPLTGWSVNSSINNTLGRATFTLTGTQSAPAGASVALRLSATVPSTNGNAIYGSKHILKISNLELKDANQTVIPSLADAGIHAVVYLGDVTGNGAINAADAAATATVAAFAKTGFEGLQNLDPILVGDTSTNGTINAVDASQIGRRAAGQNVPQVPAPPVTINSPTGGPDPKIWIGSSTATPGTNLALPVVLDSIENLTGQNAIVGFRLAITYDAAKLTFTGTTNGAFLNRPGWSLTTNSATSGKLILVGYTTTPVTGQFVQEMLQLNFAVAVGASGPTVVNLRQSLHGLNTELNSLADTALPLIPAPTDATTDVVDGTVTFLTDPNQSPINILPTGPILVAQDTAKAITGISVADPDAGPANIQITLTVNQGTLQVATNVVGGLTTAQISGNGTATVVLTAPQGTFNTTMASETGLVFTPPPGFSGNLTLTMTTNDLGNTGLGGPKSDTDSVTITVAELNDPPINTIPTSPILIIEDTPTTLTGFSVFDPDAGFASIQVTFSVNSGTLLVNTTIAGGVNAAQVSGNGTATVVLTAPQAAINATLAGPQGLVFVPLLDFTGSVTLTMTTNDLGNTGLGGPLTDTDSVTLLVEAANDPPLNTLPPGPIFIDEDTPQLLFGLAVADPDAGNAPVRVTLSVTHGRLTLFSNQAVNNGTATVTLTAPLVVLNNVLAQGVRYSPPADFTGHVTLTMTTNDLGHTGLGGPQEATNSVTLIVEPVNDPPVNTLPTGTLETLPETSLPLPGFAVFDPDAGSNDIEVTLTVSSGTLTISTIAPGGVTAEQVSGNGTATLVLTAPQAAINAALAEINSLMYHPVVGFTGLVTLTMTTNDLGHTGNGGAQQVSNSRTLLVAPRNQPPVLTVPVEIQQTLAGRALVLSNALTVNDPDAGTSDIQVSLFIPDGTLQVPAVAGLTIHGNGTGSVILTGPQAAINIALATVTFTSRAGFVGETLLTLNANDLGNFGTGGVRTDTQRVTIQVVGVVINEILFNPPGPQAPREYLEIRSTVPGFTLPQGTYFLVVEGNAVGNPGRIKNLLDLSSLTTGSNGLLVVLMRNSPYVVPAGTTVVRNEGSGPGFGNGPTSSIGHSAVGNSVTFEGDSATFLLIVAPTPPSLQSDIDLNNNGIPDSPEFTTWQVLDSVGLLDGGHAGDRAYGRINFRRGALGRAGNVVTLPFLPGYFGRNGSSMGATLADWVAGQLVGGPANWVLSRPNTVPATFRGGSVSHVGAPNLFPMTVARRLVQGNTPQRSIITRLVLTFQGRVTIANPAAAFRLEGPAGPVGLNVAIAQLAGQTRVTLTFRPGANTTTLTTPFDGSRFSLRDGIYTLTIVANQVRDLRGQLLDGDRDGTLGGDHVWQFHRLFGDHNGDGTVNALDRPAFVQALNRRSNQPGYLRHFDFDGNNQIDALDQREFRTRFGRSV